MKTESFYSALPFFLNALERHEEAEYEKQKIRIQIQTATIPGRNHLLLTHGHGGGVDKYVEDAALVIEQNQQQAWILSFQPVQRRFILSRGKIHAEDTVGFNFPAAYPEMLSHLQSLGLEKLHIHHIRYLPFYFLKDIPEFVCLLGVPYNYTIHDFITFCPRIHLIDSNFRYCGMPEDVRLCDSCITINGALTGCPDTASEWRAVGQKLLQHASRRFAPSHDTAERHQKILGNMDIQVIPHDASVMGKPHTSARDEPYVIAVIGRISRHKGADVLLACTQDAKRRNLPLRFTVIGIAAYEEELKESGVHVSGEFKEPELPELLKQAGPSLIFLPSICPETYSYVLSHIWQNGYFPVSFDLGAPAERIKARNRGLVLPTAMIDSPGQINDALLETACRL